jgi:chromosome segregation ATPase
VSLIGGALAGAASVVGNVYQRDFIKLERDLAMIRARMAEIEVEIKTIMHELSKKKTEEEEVKDDLGERQEQEGRIMQNLNKAAESLKSILDAAQLN